MSETELVSFAAAALAGLALAAAAFVAATALLAGDRQQKKRLDTVKAKPSAIQTRSAAEVSAERRRGVADTLKDVESRKAKTRLSLRLRLEQAGLAMTPNTYRLYSAGFGIIVAAGTYGAMLPAQMAAVAALAAGFVTGFGLPRWILGYLIRRRQGRFTAELANALDVVVRGVKSGLPLNECLGVIARESPAPLSTEFREVVDQQRVGVPLNEALERLTDRMPIAEMRFLTIVIAIQQQAGGNLSEALGNLSAVLRDRFKLAMKVKALSAEAKASAAVLASLPPGVCGMVYMSSPDYIMPLFSTTIGNVMLGAGLSWMLIGVLIMKKMINFKY